jgi:hypothetical protein
MGFVYKCDRCNSEFTFEEEREYVNNHPKIYRLNDMHNGFKCDVELCPSCSDIFDMFVKSTFMSNEDINKFNVESLYTNLCKHLYDISYNVLGRDYYNFSMDVYWPHHITTKDIIKSHIKCKNRAILFSIGCYLLSMICVILIIYMWWMRGENKWNYSNVWYWV